MAEARYVHAPRAASRAPSPLRPADQTVATRVYSEAPTLRFRNYEPRSEQLQGLAIEKAVAPKVEDEVRVAEAVHEDATQEPLLNLAPKRPNWDLKRDLEPQMKRLRSMTDRSIVQLIAERVASEADAEGAQPDGADLAAAVRQQQQAEADDED